MQPTSKQYIDSCIDGQKTPVCRNHATAYQRWAAQNNARMANDGYPDTRFQGTYHPDHNKIRVYINKCREEYRARYPHEIHVANIQKKRERRYA